MPPRRRTYSRRRAPARRRVARKRVYARPKRTMSRANRGRQQCVCPGEMGDGAKFALAQLDPFHVSVAGAKIPDSNVQPSISTTDVEQVNLISGAVGTNLHGFAFRPQWTWATQEATPGVPLAWGAAYSTLSTNRSKRAGYNTAIELTRPVAHAIRLSSPLAPTTASGFVHIAISTETNFIQTTWSYPTTIAQISGCQFYKRVTLASLTQSPLTVINKWVDDTAFRYSSPASDYQSSSAVNFQTDHGWGTIVVIMEGAPVSSNCLSAEHLLISEGIPQKDGPIIGTPAAASSSATMDVVSETISGTEPAHSEVEQEGYISRGVSAMAAGARRQGETAFQTIGVPLLQHAGAQAMSSATAGFMAMVSGTGGISGVNSNPNRLAN